MDALGGYVIRPDDPSRAEVLEVIARHLRLMHAITPPESVHAIDSGALAGPDVDFFSLSEGDRLLAIGALRRLGPSEGEIKSMHTLEEARGRGVGLAMLDHLMAHARKLGLSRLSLETGATEAFAPARRLYAGRGFVACGPFGDYREDPHSAFMTCRL